MNTAGNGGISRSDAVSAISQQGANAFLYFSGLEALAWNLAQTGARDPRFCWQVAIF